jgi:Domain of unknown function (DUF397)
VDVDLTGATWRKSTGSNGSGGDCVEAATTPGGSPALRDSKNPGGPALLFSASQWHAFIQDIKLSRPRN